MVTARRSYQGSLPIAAMPRLCAALAGTEGELSYAMEFGRDGLGTAVVEVRAQAPLRLLCQRSLEPFTLRVAIDSTLGLIRHEREESALPPDCEPLLVGEDGKLNPVEVIEDELLLALPLVPVNPDSHLPDDVTPAVTVAQAAPARTDHPFAVLRELKK